MLKADINIIVLSYADF